MTAQIPDIIILDGKVFDLYATPLEGYFERIGQRPFLRWWSTAHRRGYVARWEVFEQRLFLTGLFGMMWVVPPHLVGKVAPDPDPFDPQEDGVKSLRLPDLFQDQAPLVFAEWVNERLVVPTGPQLVCVNADFQSLHASYRTLDIVKGCVQSSREWDGRDWAREIGVDWLLDRLSKEEADPELNAATDEGKEEELKDWRDADRSIERRYLYQLAQIDALRKPCGKTPAQ
jgi:hypothetical protein